MVCGEINGKFVRGGRIYWRNSSPPSPNRGRYLSDEREFGEFWACEDPGLEKSIRDLNVNNPYVSP